ncbi:hypothetical protein [Maribellus mangrovi]|uniref:hypothetical protein n=1 Tax=Maribellus mangrovi TaxID=3133146 RepID=UPI0030EE1989
MEILRTPPISEMARSSRATFLNCPSKLGGQFEPEAPLDGDEGENRGYQNKIYNS